MELGEKLLQARQEAGMSQRQLCGDVITRNMLSRIEHGAARPGMDTLRYLAGRLGKPVSYFLEEDALLSPNQALMASARQKWEAGDAPAAWLLLKDFRQPDPVLEWQWRYLSALAVMEMARQACAEGKDLYARQLLEEAGELSLPELERQRLLLLGRIPGADLPGILKKLPSLDEELLLRAEAALASGEPEKARGFLGAVQEVRTARWQLLQGRCLYALGQYAPAAELLQQAEGAYPGICLPLLEACFRELGDYRQAYEYACRQR